MPDDVINKIDAQQNSRMAVLEQQVKDLKQELSRVAQEENERLKGRIRPLEKWVAGAGAVIGVGVAGLGLPGETLKPSPTPSSTEPATEKSESPLITN